MSEYLSLDAVRSKLSGLHFSQECLTEKEREILHLAEALLREIDRQDPQGYAREWTPDERDLRMARDMVMGLLYGFKL